MSVIVELGGDAAYYCGGTELLQVMKMGLADFGHLIDLKRIPDLRGVQRLPDGTTRIGAATTHGEIERSVMLAEVLPALVELERYVANVRVRSTGTLGGNLAFAEPHSDPATLLLALDANVELVGTAGTRRLPIDVFVVGPLVTARLPEEILIAVEIPALGQGVGVAYRRLAFFERPAVSIAVVLEIADGTIRSARVAAGSVTETPMLLARSCDALAARPVIEASEGIAAAAAIAAEDVEAFGDLSGSADYKRHLAGVLVERAAAGALQEALRG